MKTKWPLFFEPMGKPRMTRKDKWAKRPVVQKYWAWKRDVQKESPFIIETPRSVYVKAFFNIPPSYSKKKAFELAGQAHRVKPDADNVLKALIDALYMDDQKVAIMHIEKWWDDGKGARMEIEISL